MKPYAVKVIEISLIRNTTERIPLLVREIQILKCTDHPNIMKHHGTYIRKNQLFVRNFVEFLFRFSTCFGIFLLTHYVVSTGVLWRRSFKWNLFWYEVFFFWILTKSLKICKDLSQKNKSFLCVEKFYKYVPTKKIVEFTLSKKGSRVPSQPRIYSQRH